MPPAAGGVFDEAFLIAIKTLVNVHHSIYPLVPPQGIYFESLVEQAFNRARKPFTVIEGSGRNLAGHDLLVEDKKISLKTETGKGTKPDLISITKLCTTEREPWDALTLIGRVLAHLGRYDILLMLRAVWRLPLVHYQLVEIPINDLRLIETAEVGGVGNRGGRQSLGANVVLNNEVLYRVHFDGSDGKCSIRNLKVSNCVMLQEWDIRV
jgi:restriction endonuclease SmaI-like protein